MVLRSYMRRPHFQSIGRRVVDRHKARNGAGNVAAIVSPSDISATSLGIILEKNDFKFRIGIEKSQNLLCIFQNFCVTEIRIDDNKLFCIWQEFVLPANIIYQWQMTQNGLSVMGF